MGDSVGWFVAMAAISLLALCAGAWVGRSTRCSVGGLIVGVAVLATWAYLARHPSVAVRVIPPSVLAQIEGVAAVPAFLFIIGIVWARSYVPRQRRVAAWAAVLGGVYFLQGGLWLLQSTPQVGFASDVHRGMVKQSQEYSCVPAACATALNMLSVPTSEAEMARLTKTRPGTGATPVRALYGLNVRLDGTPYRAELLEVPPEALKRLQMPLLTPLQYEATRRHMVTVVEATQWGVWIADPIEGGMFLDWKAFSDHFGGQVLVFVTHEDAPYRPPLGSTFTFGDGH